MAVTALRSLRVDSSLDASGFARGAQIQATAERTLIEAARARAAAMAQADAAVGRAVPGMASLSRSLIDGYGNGAQFEAIIRRIGNAIDRGMPLDRATALVEAASKRFGVLADAQALAQRGFVSIAPVVADVNERIGAHVQRLERAAEATRRMAAAQQYQAQINARLGVNDNVAGAGRGEDIAAYGRSLDDLRAKYNPLFAAGRTYRETLNEIDYAARVGAIRESERATAVQRTKDAFSQQVVALRGASAANENLAGSTRLSRHELINLSRQVQDVGVSLASGQSPLTVLVQQGTQIADVFASSSGTIGGFFRQTTSWLGGFLTAGRLAFAGVTAAIGLGAAALGSYAGAQRDVQRSLAGIGRASGVTVGDVNAIAGQGASPLGLSISEAREFASALAATGKIGREEIGSLVKLGHDFAATLGADSKEAAQQLASAFSDPIRGADQLNQRLGFMDAATQRQIRNLVEQNRVAEAQRIIIDGIRSSVVGANDVTGFWAKTWTVIANAISNSYDWLGRILSRATGIGETLEDQYAKARARLNELIEAQKRAAQYTPSGNDVLDAQARRFQRGGNARTSVAGPSDREINVTTAEVERLAKAMQDQRDAAEAARLRLEFIPDLDGGIEPGAGDRPTPAAEEHAGPPRQDHDRRAGDWRSCIRDVETVGDHIRRARCGGCEGGQPSP